MIICIYYTIVHHNYVQTYLQIIIGVLYVVCSPSFWFCLLLFLSCQSLRCLGLRIILALLVLNVNEHEVRSLPGFKQSHVPFIAGRACPQLLLASTARNPFLGHFHHLGMRHLPRQCPINIPLLAICTLLDLAGRGATTNQDLSHLLLRIRILRLPFVTRLRVVSLHVFPCVRTGQRTSQG